MISRAKKNGVTTDGPPGLPDGINNSELRGFEVRHPLGIVVRFRWKKENHWKIIDVLDDRESTDKIFPGENTVRNQVNAIIDDVERGDSVVLNPYSWDDEV